MSNPNPIFADFLRRLHGHVETAIRPVRHGFDIGYAVGKLLCHYQKSMTKAEIVEFEQGVSAGFEQGSITLLH